MARVLQVLLHVDHVVLKNWPASDLVSDGGGQFGLVAHHAHAATTTATGGLDDHRIPDPLGDGGVALASLSTGPSEPGTQGTPAFFIASMAETLSPIRRMVSARGPMKMKPDFDHFGEVGILGEEAVARVDGDGTGHPAAAMMAGTLR